MDAGRNSGSGRFRSGTQPQHFISQVKMFEHLSGEEASHLDVMLRCAEPRNSGLSEIRGTNQCDKRLGEGMDGGGWQEK